MDNLVESELQTPPVSASLIFEAWVPLQVRQEMNQGFARLYEWRRQTKLRADLSEELVLQRDAICKILGYGTYGGYLRSGLWEATRHRVFERDGMACKRCGGKADRVHHRSYTREVMTGGDDEQLASVCEGCHDVIHWDDLRQRRIQSEWDLVLLDKDTRCDFPIPKIDMRRGRSKQLLPKECRV